MALRGGALGDFILTLPALRALREHFPGRLELAAHPAYAELAVREVLADHGRDLGAAAFAPFFARGGDLDAGWAAWFAGFDRVVSWLLDPEGILRENLLRAGACLALEIDPRPDREIPAARHLSAPLAGLGIGPIDATPSLARAFPRTPDDAGDPGSPLFAIHPGSGSAAKNWPAGRWAELARALLAQHPRARLLLVGGEADTDAIGYLVGELDPRRTWTLDRRPLPEVGAALAHASLFLGHDSGVSHLAAAIGVPCLLLFGPTDPAVWAPAGQHVRVLRAPDRDLRQLETARVLAAL